MPTRPLRTTLIGLNAFLALTAFAGGIGLAFGWNAPPLEMLAHSPFHSFLAPSLALFVAVGGSALAAAVLAWRRDGRTVAAAAFAAAMVLCFEGVEVWVIGSPAGVARNLQLFYVALGLGIAVAAMALRRAQRPDADR
ncbi:MAG: hypothetical protein ABI780_01540 [Ardenticatenales bacterium]